MTTTPAPTINSAEWQPGNTARVGEVVSLTASLANITTTTPLTFTIREYSGGQYQERIVETLITTAGPGSTTMSVNWPVRLVTEPGQAAGLPEYRFRVQLGTNGPVRTSALLKPGRLTRVDWIPLDGASAELTSSSCQVAFAPGQRVGLVAKGTKLQGFKANFAILQRQETEEGGVSYIQVDQINGIPFTPNGSPDTVTAMTEWRVDETSRPELAGGKFRFRVMLTHPSVPDEVFAPTQQSSRSKLACNKLSAPQIVEIFPNEGGLDEEVIVTVKGFNFRSGARVKFGTVKESEEVVFVDDRTLTAKAPIRATAKKVDIYVINPDGQTTLLADAFTYLSKGQKAQAHVLFVEPLTVLEGVATEIVIYGRHLKEAVEDGFFGLRAPQRANIERLGEPIAVHDEASQIDTVIFKVRITPQQGSQPLTTNERMPVNILASRRANAAEDLLVESSQKVFTVLSGSGPVPMAYTKTLNRGQSNVVVVAGRNLANCRLEFASAQGPLFLDEQQGDERAIFGVASLEMETPASLNLILFDPDNAEVGRFDLSLGSIDESGGTGTTSVAGTGGVVALMTENGVMTLPIDLQPVSGQRLVTAPASGSKVFDLAAGGYLDISAPDFNSPHLNNSVTSAVTSIELALYSVELIFPFFDRGTESLIDTPINARVGRLFGIRASAILLILRLSVNVDIEVGIIITINDPFDDVAFSDGAVLEVQVEFVVELEISISLRFVLAVLRPKLEVPTGLILTELVVLAFLDLDFSLGSDGLTLNLAFGLGFRVRLLGPISPFLSPGQIENGLIQIASADPCLDNFGFRSYFFAGDNRQFCLNWRFPVLLERVFEFAGTSEPRETILQETFEAQVCINVNANNDLRRIYFESPQITGDPPELFLDPEGVDTATVLVKAQPVNGQGEPTGAPQTLIPGKDVDLVVVPVAPKIVDIITVENTAPINIKALVKGEVEIRAQVSTSGMGMGILPGSVLGFATNEANPCLPMLISAALPTSVGEKDPNEGDVVIPTPVHPKTGEAIRVQLPYLNVNNGSLKPDLTYEVEFRILRQGQDGKDEVVAFGSTPAMLDNNGITYWQYTDGKKPLAVGKYTWQARAVEKDKKPENEMWSEKAAFEIKEIWSIDGETWHFPFTRKTISVSGTFMEAYYHDGYVGSGLHGGLDLSVGGEEVLATRSGRCSGFMKCKKTGETLSVDLYHPSVQRLSGYLHMSNLAPNTAKQGVYVNQGAKLGIAAKACTKALHLHFDIANETRKTFYNPLLLNLEGWEPPASAKPQILRVWLRNKPFLDGTDVGLKDKVYVIIETVDPSTKTLPPPTGQRLAPYRVEFKLNDTPVGRVIEFKEFKEGDKASDFYAGATFSPGAPNKVTEIPDSGTYLLYYAWDTKDLQNNPFAGPQTIRIKAEELIAGNKPLVESDPFTITIGPWFEPTGQIKVPVPQGQSVGVPIKLFNRNTDNINKGMNDRYKNDTYKLTLEKFGPPATATLKLPLNKKDEVTVDNGNFEMVTVSISEAAPGSVLFLRATSQICPDISYTVSINVE